VTSYLGLSGETAVAVKANHFGVCRFDKPSNGNYKVLRDEIVQAVEDVLEDRTYSPPFSPVGFANTLKYRR
jgi:hypothetical protein